MTISCAWTCLLERALSASRMTHLFCGLYAASVWANALQNHAIQRKLFSVQRSVALRIVSAYRTVSTSAALVLASVPPIDLLMQGRQETFQLRKELTCTNLQEVARAREETRREMADEMKWWADRGMDLPPDPRARHLAEQKVRGSWLLLGASTLRLWLF